jgi:hypothetical protein
MGENNEGYSREFLLNNKTYRVKKEGSIIERKSGENWVNIGTMSPGGGLSPTNDATEQEVKNFESLVKEGKKAIAGPTATEETIVYRGVQDPKTKKTTPFNTIKVYPKNMSPKQDRMEFSVWQYADRTIQKTVSDAVAFGSTRRATAETGYNRVTSAGFVYLPINKVADTNSVDWQEDRINELQRQLANMSLGVSLGSGDRQGVENEVGKFDPYTRFATGTPAGNLIRTFLAGQAVQVNNLLTRATGSTLNPNLELLFNGPQLRQFSFSFDLFAKEKQEATIIKDIIYFFKAYMAVRDTIGDIGQFGPSTENQQSTLEPQTSSVGVFLNSPYVFRVKYIKGNKNDQSEEITGPENSIEHPSIGKIKMCALQSCTVDYTPLGTYMTFNDESDSEATMVMYRITLQFKELTPIYASDYEGTHPIGY